MQLKYDLYTINNAMGSGKSRQYVRLILREPLTARELETAIEKRCSLTKGDVAAVLTELRDLCVQAFIEGRRFYIPEIGYLSLSAVLSLKVCKYSFYSLSFHSFFIFSSFHFLN